MNCVCVMTLAMTACGRIGFAPMDGASDATTDVGDAPRPLCTTPFGPPQSVAELASPAPEFAPDFSEDGLELYWHDNEPAGMGGDDLWFATRPTTSAPFGARAPVANVNSSANDGGVSLSLDGLELYFSSERAGGGDGEIYVARRATRSSQFSTPQRVVELSSPGYESSPALSADGLEVYFASDRTGGVGLRDVWFASRPTTLSAFGPPQNLGGLNTALHEGSPMITANGLTLVYDYSLPGESVDIFVATRATRVASFTPGVRVDEVSLPNAADLLPWISASGERLAFCSDRDGTFDLFVATRVCP